jgi:hypothetical protein
MTKKLRGRSSLSKAGSRPPAAGRVLTIGQQAQINLVVLDLSRLVIGMREELRHLLRKDIAFDLSLLATGRCLVNADRHQMRELVHLVLDARDAMPHGGSLSIAIERKRIDEAVALHPGSSGDYVMVSVRDIPTRKTAGAPERLDFRVLKGRSLSLAAGYDAIKRCGGHISVSRRAGETVVRVFLPCLAPRCAQAAFGSASR